MWRLQALGQVGALEGGGVCRLALGEEDRQGRDLVSRWMRELGLKVSVDQIGNALADEALLKVAEERALAAVATVCVAADIDWERRSLADDRRGGALRPRSWPFRAAHGQRRWPRRPDVCPQLRHWHDLRAEPRRYQSQHQGIHGP